MQLIFLTVKLKSVLKAKFKHFQIYTYCISQITSLHFNIRFSKFV